MLLQGNAAYEQTVCNAVPDSSQRFIARQLCPQEKPSAQNYGDPTPGTVSLPQEHSIAATLIDLDTLPWHEAELMPLAQANQGQMRTMEDKDGASPGRCL